MTRALLAALLLAAAPAAAQAPQKAALFSDLRTAKSGQIYLTAGPAWFKAGPEARARAVRAELARSGKTLAAVVRPGGGEVWELRSGRACRMDSWSDDRPPRREDVRRTGRWFGFLGGQMSSGGAAEGTGFNGRIGTTLLDNRYDAAASIGFQTVKASPSHDTRTLGLMGRALFPIDRKKGWNLGAQLSRSDPSVGDSVTALSALAGLTFYQPSGSFDLTLVLGNHGTLGLVVGYTFYLTR